jgi:hypothetical protein
LSRYPGAGQVLALLESQDAFGARLFEGIREETGFVEPVLHEQRMPGLEHDGRCFSGAGELRRDGVFVVV